MNDSRIIELYWSRDEEAIAETNRKYGNLCRSIAGNILHREQDTEECLNDVRLKVWNAIPPERPRYFKAWLCRVTRNTALNRWHRENAAKRGSGNTALIIEELAECVADDQRIEHLVEGKELVQLLNAWLRELPASDRNLFLQRYWYGMPVKDIAAERGEPANRTAQTLYRLRQTLKQVLDKEGYYHE